MGERGWAGQDKQEGNCRQKRPVPRLASMKQDDVFMESHRAEHAQEAEEQQLLRHNRLEPEYYRPGRSCRGGWA